MDSPTPYKFRIKVDDIEMEIEGNSDLVKKQVEELLKKATETFVSRLGRRG